MSRIHAALVGSFLATLWAAPAHAGGRVAVLGIQGDRTGDVEHALTKIVKDEHEVVSARTFDRAADRAGVRDYDSRGIAKVARKLDVEAVLEGTMRRDDSGYQLHIRIRDAHGATSKKLTVLLPGRRLSARTRRSLGDRILGALDDVDAHSRRPTRTRSRDDRRTRRARGRDDDRVRGASDRDMAGMRDDDRSDRRARDRDDDRSDRRARDRDDDDRSDRRARDRGDDGDRDRVAMRDDDGDRDGDRDEDRRDDGVSAHAASTPRARVRAFEVEAGPSVTGRTLKFTTRGADFTQAPNGYKGPYVPGAHVTGAVYPLAFGKSAGAAAGLGVAFEYDQTMSLTTRTSEAMDVAMPTTEKHWMVGARYRIRFGHKATSPSVTLAAGYGRRVFRVDRSGLPAGANLDLPDVDYRFFDPGLAFRIPVGSRVALTGEGHALLFRTAGAIQSAAEYGAAKLTGADATGGLEIMVTPRVLVHLSGYVTMIGFNFVGNGAQTNNRDGDSTTQDVGGALDQYLGGSATVGVSY